MPDNVIQFPKRPAKPGPTRNLIIEVGEAASIALDRRLAEEAPVNKTTVFNRAITVYDELISDLDKLEPGEGFVFRMSALPGKEFVVFAPRRAKRNWFRNIFRAAKDGAE